ncbi:MAG: hypothetical protein RML94_09850, partial [Bacteroidia bacterium]|nr:hypothetical protein [Bacteroidia bacterium]
MAFIEFEKDEEKDNQQQLVNSPSTPQSPHMPQQPQAPQRGLFTNVKQLLKVGQGAGQQMAQRASGLMFKDIQQAASKIEDVKKVQQETEQEKQQFQTDASQIEEAIAQARQTNLGNQGQLSSIVSDENIDKYHNVVQGKTNLADLQNRFLQQTALTSAGLTQTGQALETNIGTEAGRFNLLRRAIKGPTYTRGQQALDHLL